MKWTVLLQYPQTGETYLWSGEAKTAADSAEAAKRQAREDNDESYDFDFLMAMPGDHWLIHHGDVTALPDTEPEAVDKDFESAVDSFNATWGLSK
jgi:hypothetical protein